MIGEEDTSLFSVNEQGYYQLGLIKGHALPVENVRYIGRTARKRFREEQIERFEKELEELRDKKIVISNRIRDINDVITVAKNSLDDFPKDADLQESFRHIEKARFDITQFKQRIQHLSEQIKEIHQHYSKVKGIIDEKIRQFNIERSLKAYQQAVSVMKRYQKDLFGLEKQHIQYVNEAKRMVDKEDQLMELREGIDELQGDVNVSTSQAETHKQNIHHMEQQLDLEGAADIRKEIIEVQERLKEINDNLKTKEITKPTKETELNHQLKELDRKQIQLQFWRNMTEAWKGSFKKEVHRDFIEINKEHTWLQIAENLLNEYGVLWREKDSSNY